MSAHTPMQLSISTKAQDGVAAMPLAQGPTPPMTPTIEDGTASTTSATLPSPNSSSSLSSVVAVAASSPPQFSNELEYQLDPKGRPIEFGRGAWSVVYKAFSSTRAEHPTRPITPPSSPTPASRLVAVKSPARRDARAVLHTEALILTRARSVLGSEHHVVRFHGFIAESSSIVMAAVPLSLSTYIEDQARLAQKNKTTQNMFTPVLGMAQWHDLAKKLVASLLWLHSNALIMHGDIKPHNILLQPQMSIDDDTDSAGFPYEPLFADFSSAYPITTSEESTNTALTALTPPFTAPELLCVSSLSSPDVAPTPASDVFSLAVTLLAAATGDLLLYPGYNNIQRLMMARDGHRVIDFIRSGDNCTRVPRNGLVEKIVKPAIAKDPAERISSGDWLQLAQTA
ncbi:kinase-like domain-containing protein [Aspergillus cavernicola]|uniref:Kinase-like domain-containing protein n=1 Tax=Aspergillus cavernicola TaxID=176166 RepID=A0ABR4J4U7_9EURO